MARKIAAGITPIETIERRIYLIRGHKVMLDSDLAELYQVPTFRLNEAVKRNKNRFPDDFMFQLDEREARAVNSSQIARSSKKHRGIRYLPYAFTEHGVAMLSAVLRSDQAVQVSILIVRAFVDHRPARSRNRRHEAPTSTQASGHGIHCGSRCGCVTRGDAGVDRIRVRRSRSPS